MPGNAALNALMIFPWPEKLLISVDRGQLGVLSNLSWQEYLQALGSYWDVRGKYPRHRVTLSFAGMNDTELQIMALPWGLAVQALLNARYMDEVGNLYPGGDAPLP